MLLSMTGYGRVKKPYGDKHILIEIKSLNSKFTDIRLKIPQNYREKEAELRKILGDRIERGKIEFNIEIQSHQGDETYSLNQVLFRKYYRELHHLANELNLSQTDMLSALLKLPNVITTESEDLDEAEWYAVNEALYDAIQAFHQYRTDEGHAMELDLTQRLRTILGLIDELQPLEQQRSENLRKRLQQNLEEFMGREKIDESRFEQEVLYYLEKMDINEEKVRLRQHCDYFLEELQNEQTLKGRKLSFISQEMGREINTLGSKAYSTDIQRIVVNMKDELEKIKEQVANSV